MTDIDLHYAPLLEVADCIKARKLSPVELTRSLLDRIEKLEPHLHSYATVTPELALAQAARAEQEVMNGKHRGPLHGVPIAVKDICYTAGITTAAGTAIHAHSVPEFDATVVKRLVDTGAVLLGKLQLTESAFAKHHPKLLCPGVPGTPRTMPAHRQAVRGLRPPRAWRSARSGAIQEDLFASPRLPMVLPD